MCLAVPGKIIAISETTATIDMEGNSITADISIVPDAVVGDWAIIHAGFVIQKYDEHEALETLKLLREAAQMGEVK
ncbi:MAG: HypC/HybG/HupF family hydrogenase formation chaperone [Proteobacteria bacterium]|nr:HypC/HybG/HupF family hydrogenase formation chaperone [Pseudomonadota bacterium]